MFYFLSKTLDFLLMPFSIVLLLLLFSLIIRKQTYSQRAVLIALVTLYLISNGYLVSRAYNWWEHEPKNINSLQQTYDVGVVLTGGMISVPSLKVDHPGLGNHADRFMQAYLLYKAGKIRKILISGRDHPDKMAKNLGDGQQAAALLAQWGVAPGDIILEGTSRNTRENAVNSATVLKSRFPAGKYLLITSAFHLRRAQGCFEKAGIATDTFPADIYGGDFAPSVKQLLVPDPEVVGYSHLLWHEWIGYMVYKLVGYC
ncbi:YdcF family protein [Telluribacter sp. SYSU D00476]|uniref:YdcF family protein n=1 Tax=Telluribacter sp. SYSU D00476 TaxID=2811430 RepID=UPI001FF0F5E8|nr:YdcF family protein [Telluribacter sp. SYSU D00476]